MSDQWCRWLCGCGCGQRCSCGIGPCDELAAHVRRAGHKPKAAKHPAPGRVVCGKNGCALALGHCCKCMTEEQEMRWAKKRRAAA